MQSATKHYLTCILLTLFLFASTPAVSHATVAVVEAQANAKASAKLVAAARVRTQQRERYDGTYRVIAYPLGDVPDDQGVCTDLLVRAYRQLGIDLQVRVHEDMARHFAAYPKIWGMRAPDRNIDHRRVPNLQTFLSRAGASLPVSQNPQDFRPGDLVTWRLAGNLPHIGIVSDRKVMFTQRPKILHNIGAGSVEDDILFAYAITGHYRYLK